MKPKLNPNCAPRHNHYQNNINYHQHILNVKTELPMWYNIFLKGFLTSVYHSNNNCHNYHYDCHYCPYYHLTCHHHHQNVNYYAQVNIHIRHQYSLKSLSRENAIFLSFLPLFCRMEFVTKTLGLQNMYISRQMSIFPHT